MTTHPTIIIGGGNMGGAIALALHAANPDSVHVVEADAQKRAAFASQGITAHDELQNAPLGSLYLLAIKPQQFHASIPALTHVLSDREPLLVSIMAGVKLKALQAITPNAVRVMPNLPALIGESMSVLYAENLSEAMKTQVDDLFGHIGAIAWVEDEDAIHAVTAISGSGPAYLFAFMEAMQQAAIAQGLPAELASKLIRQTMRGAALLADGSATEFSRLREQVTSKGGTTEAALGIFANHHLERVVKEAVEAAAERSIALGNH